MKSEPPAVVGGPHLNQSLVGHLLPVDNIIYRLSYATYTATRAVSNTPSSLRTSRTFVRLLSVIGTSGRRNFSSNSPIRAIAAYTGPGLDSMKFTSISDTRR